MGDAVRPGGKLAALPTGNPDQACCAASRCAVALDARASRTLSAPATCLDLQVSQIDDYSPPCTGFRPPEQAADVARWRQ